MYELNRPFPITLAKVTGPGVKGVKGYGQLDLTNSSLNDAVPTPLIHSESITWGGLSVTLLSNSSRPST